MSSPPGEEPEASVLLASGSDVGQVRSANEDSCDTLIRADGTRLLVVADGMGGARGGATASQIAVATMAETFEANASARPSAMLESAIREANSRVYTKAQQDPELEGMGTTVVAFLLDARARGTVAHVGDSRAYRYRRGRLDPITTDHSLVADLHARGLLSADEAALHPRRNEILRAVGVLPEVDVEIADVDVEPGDRFLLCSDGLSGVLKDDEIAAVVQSESPDAAVVSLIRKANERGGPDNITVQILAIPTDESEGDPEATAPVELSEVGIEAIESKRRDRKRVRRLVGLLAVVTASIGGYFLWRLLTPPEVVGTRTHPGMEDASPVPESAAPGMNPATGEPFTSRLEDQFEIQTEPPRRGIPRDPTRL